MMVFIKYNLSFRCAGIFFSEDILKLLTRIKCGFPFFLFLIKWIEWVRHIIRVKDAHSKSLIKWFSSIIQINFLVDNFYLMSQMPIVDVSLSFKSLDRVISLCYVMQVINNNLVLPVSTSYNYDRVIFFFMGCMRATSGKPKGCLNFSEIHLLSLVKHGAFQIFQSVNSESALIEVLLYVLVALLLNHNKLTQQKLQLCLGLFFRQRVSFRCWFDEIYLIILWIFNWDEEIFEIVDIAGGLTFFTHGWSWQALGLHHGLSDQLEPMLYLLEEKGMVPEWHKEIVTKRSIFNIKPLF